MLSLEVDSRQVVETGLQTVALVRFQITVSERESHLHQVLSIGRTVECSTILIVVVLGVSLVLEIVRISGCTWTDAEICAHFPVDLGLVLFVKVLDNFKDSFGLCRKTAFIGLVVICSLTVVFNPFTIVIFSCQQESSNGIIQARNRNENQESKQEAKSLAHEVVVSICGAAYDKRCNNDCKEGHCEKEPTDVLKQVVGSSLHWVQAIFQKDLNRVLLSNSPGIEKLCNR